MVMPTKDAMRLLLRGQEALAQVEANGFRTDVEQVRATRAWADRRIALIESELKEMDEWRAWRTQYGPGAELGSADQLAYVLFEKMGYENPKFGKKRPSTDEESLEKLNIPFLQKYLDWRRLNKLNSTSLKGIEREAVDGILRCSFGLHIAKTFRSTCSDPNLQNVPIRNPMIGRAIRQCFIPREGHVLIEFDFSGIEVRGAAWYTHDPMLIKYIEDPTTDMHRDMSAECFMIPQDKVTKAIRSQVKGLFVFAEFYGDFYASVAKGLWDAIGRFHLEVDGISLYGHLAKLGITSCGACDPRKDPKTGTFEAHIKAVEHRFWNDRFRVYNKWKVDTHAQYLRDGYYQTLTGFVLRAISTRNQILNAPIQGTAFQCLLWSLIEVNDWLIRTGKKSMIVCQIHDSMVLDVHSDEIEAVTKMVKHIMTERLREHWAWICTPLEIEAEGCQLGESWHDKKVTAI